MDRCELGVYICLCAAWRVDLVVRNTVIVHRQQLDRCSWGPNDCYKSTGFPLPLWQPVIPPGMVAAVTSTPIHLPAPWVSMSHGCCFKRSLVFTEHSSGRRGAQRQPHEEHGLSNPGTETLIHSWIGSWRRFAANLGRRGNLRNHKHLVLLAELIFYANKMCSHCRGLFSSHLWRQLLWTFGIESGFYFNGLSKPFKKPLAFSCNLSVAEQQVNVRAADSTMELCTSTPGCLSEDA